MSKINKVKVNDVSYDIEDLSVGDLATLNTTDKTNIVNAINEVFTGLASAGGITYLSKDTLITNNPTGFYVATKTLKIKLDNTTTNTFTTVAGALIIWNNATGSGTKHLYMFSGYATGIVIEAYINPGSTWYHHKFNQAQYVSTNNTGYDKTKTQILKNINGTLTWVTE